MIQVNPGQGANVEIAKKNPGSVDSSGVERLEQVKGIEPSIYLVFSRL